MSHELARAVEFAKRAHGDHTNRRGLLVIDHVLRVSAAGATDEERIVGALHDVVEDTDVSVDDLRREGFSPNVVAAVEALTRLDDERYAAYIARVARNQLAVGVKLNDLRDNISHSPPDDEMQGQYHEALSFLAQRPDRGD